MTYRFLFIHQNFPGQYKHLAAALLLQGHQCVAIGGQGAPGLKGIKLVRVNFAGVAAPPGLHPWAHDLHVKCLRGEAIAQEAFSLSSAGFKPDLIIGHPGWGELLAIKDVFPDVPVLHQMEFVYQLRGADTGFDPEFVDMSDPSKVWRASARLRLRRTNQLLAFHDLDHAIAPTKWQASMVPNMFSQKVSVIHEGINTCLIKPNNAARVELKGAGMSFEFGDEVVSFVARNLEPYRGFHVFMRMLPLLQKQRPNCHVVIVGSDGVSYGSPPSNASNWRHALLQELRGSLDFSRIHFVGKVPHDVLHNLFQVTACHVYLTYPFILSWSVLEAMSCGAIVVASDTAPVREVIEDGKNGFLVDFFDTEALANRVSSVLAGRDLYNKVATAARQTVVDHYDLNDVCLPRHLALINALIHG